MKPIGAFLNNYPDNDWRDLALVISRVRTYSIVLVLAT